MSKRSKSAKQFNVKKVSISSIIWKVCVILLIVAMLISAAFALILLFVPQQQQTQIDPATLQQLQQEIQNQTITLSITK